MGRLVPLIACATVLVGAACAGGDDLGPTATVPTAVSSPSPSSVATTTVVPVSADPFAIPEVIDAAYVNRVLAALYAVDGDVTREILRTREVGFHAISRLGAIYGEPQLTIELQGLPGFLQQDPALFKDPPGNRVVAVKNLVLAERTCILALAAMSLAEVAKTPSTLAPGESYFVALVSKQGRLDRSGLNPTPWLIAAANVLGPDELPREGAPCG